MQLGLGEAFTYRACGICGSLHIARVPPDLGRFYPSDYYSFAAAPQPPIRWPRLRLWAAGWLIGSPDPLARAIAQGLSHRRFGFFNWCRLTGTGPGDSILDIGCGSGTLLRRMRRFGFGPLTGIDPYAPAEVREPGLTILKSERPPAGAAYDLVMMNHVLEHLPDPAAGLARAKASLAPGGRLLVRVPIAGSAAHREFGPFWYNLDAPRHLVIPSLNGMSRLAAQAGLRLLHTSFDGEESSFLMSQSYREGYSSKSAPRPPRRTRVSVRRRAHRLNRSGDGDMAVFVLEPQ